MMNDKTKNNPVKVFSCGAIKAAIWLDAKVVDNAVVQMHSIKIDRSYKDNVSGQWKSTTIFNAEDLLKIATVAAEAYKFIRLRESDKPAENTREMI